MPVTGVAQVVAALNRVPETVTAMVKEALAQGAGIVLQDMKAMTPLDSANPGSHAREGLVTIISDDGLKANIGLPTPELASDYFWFRFLDGGTKGGEISYWRRVNGVRTKHTMNVPSRPAMHIRERALDGNIDEVRRLIVEAIAEGLKQA